MYLANIIKDSISDAGTRLITYELAYPRFVHAELLTHRTFSRNSASSRAIPVSKMLARIKSDPALPVYWGKNQAGMQAAEELEGHSLQAAKNIWLEARDAAVGYADEMNSLGVHKQITNRLTEPWMWITVLASSTTFTNWDKLRAHKDAQPEIRHLADMMLEVRANSTPTYLPPGDFHLPFWEQDDENHLIRDDNASMLRIAGQPVLDVDPVQWLRVMVSSGRAARLSYLTHHGVRDLTEDLTLAARLIAPGHLSPFEHAAQAMGKADWNEWVLGGLTAHTVNEKYNGLATPIELGNFVGWKQARKFIPQESGYAV